MSLSNGIFRSVSTAAVKNAYNSKRCATAGSGRVGKVDGTAMRARVCVGCLRARVCVRAGRVHPSLSACIRVFERAPLNVKRT
eukprot:3593529-Pleurochrysis_carterae.AAC.1